MESPDASLLRMCKKFGHMPNHDATKCNRCQAVLSDEIKETRPAEVAKTIETISSDSSTSPAEQIVRVLWLGVLKPKKFNREDWTRQAKILLSESSLEEILGVIRFSLEENPFSYDYLTKATDAMATFIKNYDDLRRRYAAAAKVGEIKAHQTAKKDFENHMFQPSTRNMVFKGEGNLRRGFIEVGPCVVCGETEAQWQARVNKTTTH